MNDEQLLRYSKQILLPEIDIAGQQKLMQSHVLIVGAGGLGCPAAMYLASSGVSALTLSDSDTVELSNLHRQIAYETKDIGCKKTDSLKSKLKKNNPEVMIYTMESITQSNIQKVLHNIDVVLDCSDNFSTRYLLNQACVSCKIPLVSATAIGYTGQISTFEPYKKNSPCYHCLYPDASQELSSCNTSGVIAPAVGIMGTFQAMEAIKLITGIGKTLTGKLLLFNALTSEFDCVKVTSDNHCQVCKTSVND